MSDFKLACVLFDLDGTLVDTAPDLVACLNKALSAHGYPAAHHDTIKPHISFGAAAMIKASVGDQANDAQQAEILETVLDFYQNNIAEHSEFFSGMTDTLNLIESQGLKWGVVTNKRKRFTEPLMDALELSQRAACIISGDSTAHPKPHVLPMLTACQIAEVDPQHCVYIGDARHDIIAGNNANMHTLAALWGYIRPDDQPETWGANALIESPVHLADWINTALCR
ncbi:N-acetylmuramic acid 6-phosphate phosphatase MupP [Methylosoma difficile]